MIERRDGVEELREALDVVARDLENRRSPGRPRLRLLPWGMAAAAAVVLLAVWLAWPGASDPPEVEVLVLKVRGRAVQARMVEGQAPSTIIIVPRNGSAPLAALPAPLAGGAP